MKASSGVILCVTNSNTVICYKLSVDREHSLDLRVCSHKLFFVNLHHVKIYLCNIPPRAVLMLSFSKLLSYLYFYCTFKRCFVDKNCLHSKDEIVKCVIFCYTKEINKLYDAKQVTVLWIALT